MSTKQSDLREGHPTGAARSRAGVHGGKVHAVDPATNHGKVVNVGTALCGVSVIISRHEYDPVGAEHPWAVGGYCANCRRRAGRG